jgi:phytoene dehydrogenase-like protein
MSETYDIVIAGGGHNALVLGCYLAKAGVKVCVVERNEKVGGGVMTREYTLPGFKHDTHSVAHTIIQGNPLIQRDELGLKSKYGLTYVNPDKMTAAIFEDGSILEFYSDLERTCQSIAKFSQRDAEAYRRFNNQVMENLDMLVMGMFSVPPTAGAQAAMLDQSAEGRELLRTQSISSWDLIEEWFEHPKIKIALARYASEAMTNPFDNGTGFGFYIILPFMYRYGTGVPVGGSWALAEALQKCFLDSGGTIKLNSTVKQILIRGQEARGVVLESGEEIAARKGVVSSLHVQQVFPDMVPGFSLPEDFTHNVRRVKYAGLQPFQIHLALNEDPKFKVREDIKDFFWVEKSHSDIEQFAQAFRDLEYGYPRRDFACYVGQHKVDPTRIPAGKGALHLYAFQPYNLKDGGPKKWDEIGKQVYEGFIEDLRQITTNMSDDNILGYNFLTPLDLERHNNAMKHADIGHIGLYSWQLGGNRPVPGWGQYKTPVPKLYLCGASTHPGSGVTGGSGRNAAYVILEDLGMDFDRVIGG